MCQPLPLRGIVPLSKIYFLCSSLLAFQDIASLRFEKAQNSGVKLNNPGSSRATRTRQLLNRLSCFNAGEGGGRRRYRSKMKRKKHKLPLKTWIEDRKWSVGARLKYMLRQCADNPLGRNTGSKSRSDTCREPRWFWLELENEFL